MPHTGTAALGAWLDAIPVAMLAIADDGSILRANARANALFGYVLRELESLLASDVVRVGAPASLCCPLPLANLWAEATVDGAPAHGLRKDGSKFPASVSMSLLETPAGDVVLCGVCNVMVEDEAGRTFRMLFESAPDAVIVTNAEGVIELVNGMTEQLFGYESRELVGKPVEMLMPACLRAAHVRHVKAFAHDPGHRAMGERGKPFLARRRDGSEFSAEVSLAPIRTQKGLLLSAAVRDVSEPVALRARLREQGEKLRQAEKLEAVGRLAGGVAHDFNNLLTAITSFAGFVRDELPGDDLLLRDIHEVISAADRAAALTRQLLTFSRQQPLNPRPTDLNKQLLGLETMLRRTLGEDAAFVLELGEEPMVVLADPGQLDQLVINLVLNARDAIPAGGRIRVATRALPRGTRPDSRSDGPSVWLEVEDNGTGMDEETLARIFDPFFTTKGLGEGTGLGLATCYGIVEELGGDIRVRSALGDGSSFSIRFPRHSGAARPTSSDVVPVSLRGTETILVVEDADAVRRVAKRTLERYGYTVLLAEDAPLALSVYEANLGEIDLLFSDVVLPGGNGFELAAAIRERSPDLPILLTSGYANLRGFPDGPPAFSVLWKPYGAAELANATRKQLDARGA
ncbi:MAG: PAS domain S-box protein [Myxococcales bacterium]|nr:PAS domain S-box protein [Myxococcales bacterium]